MKMGETGKSSVNQMDGIFFQKGISFVRQNSKLVGVNSDSRKMSDFCVESNRNHRCIIIIIIIIIIFQNISISIDARSYVLLFVVFIAGIALFFPIVQDINRSNQMHMELDFVLCIVMYRRVYSSLHACQCVCVYVHVHLFIGSFSRSICLFVFVTHTHATHIHSAIERKSHWRAHKYIQTHLKLRMRRWECVVVVSVPLSVSVYVCRLVCMIFDRCLTFVCCMFENSGAKTHRSLTHSPDRLLYSRFEFDTTAQSVHNMVTLYSKCIFITLRIEFSSILFLPLTHCKGFGHFFARTQCILLQEKRQSRFCFCADLMLCIATTWVGGSRFAEFANGEVAHSPSVSVCLSLAHSHATIIRL